MGKPLILPPQGREAPLGAPTKAAPGGFSGFSLKSPLPGRVFRGSGGVGGRLLKNPPAQVLKTWARAFRQGQVVHPSSHVPWGGVYPSPNPSPGPPLPRATAGLSNSAPPRPPQGLPGPPPRSPQDPSKTVQVRQDAPKTPPRCSKRLPRRSQDVPRCLQEASGHLWKSKNLHFP